MGRGTGAGHGAVEDLDPAGRILVDSLLEHPQVLRADGHDDALLFLGEQCRQAAGVLFLVCCAVRLHLQAGGADRAQVIESRMRVRLGLRKRFQDRGDLGGPPLPLLLNPWPTLI